jgi:hypothetical protein
MQTKNCQNCNNNFEITKEDFDFFEKISSACGVELINPPSLCFPCRMKRKLSWRNERSWHRRVCDATGKNILSIISPDKPYKVYDQEYWKSDAWDALSFGVDYDFSKTFTEQFSELMKTVPHPNLITRNCINSDYANYSTDAKNCYFSASFVDAEDCAYIFGANTDSKFSMDLHQCGKSEYGYELIDCIKSYTLSYSQNCEACVDSSFLYDCKNCSNCVGCVGLRGQSYHIFNKQYSKEEYEAKVKDMQLYTRSGLVKVQKEFEALKMETPRKFAVFTKADNCVGDDMLNARGIYFSFYARDVENVRYSFRAWANSKDVWDTVIAWDRTELCYDSVSVNAQKVLNSSLIWGGFDVLYSYNCFSCNNIFGCIGLRNKSYCIFNKQYSKEEYHEIIKKIIHQMKEAGEHGEFFAGRLSPFGYNETMANEYFPITEAEAQNQGFNWATLEQKSYNITLTSQNLPDNINEVGDSVMQETIECAHQGKCSHGCSTAFKVTNFELSFYKKFSIPLPSLCPLCRHRERLAKKNPLNLWHGSCKCTQGNHGHTGKCINEFETPYAPDRPEKVYCEACYNKEVY